MEKFIKCRVQVIIYTQIWHNTNKIFRQTTLLGPSIAITLYVCITYSYLTSTVLLLSLSNISNASVILFCISAIKESIEIEVKTLFHNTFNLIQHINIPQSYCILRQTLNCYLSSHYVYHHHQFWQLGFTFRYKHNILSFYLKKQCSCLCTV